MKKNQIIKKCTRLMLVGLITLSVTGCGLLGALVERSPLGEAKDLVDGVKESVDDALGLDDDSSTSTSRDSDYDNEDDFGTGTVIDDGNYYEDDGEAEDVGPSESELAQACNELKNLDGAYLSRDNYYYWVANVALQVEYIDYMCGAKYSKTRGYKDLNKDEKDKVLFNFLNYNDPLGLLKQYGVYDDSGNYPMYVYKDATESFLKDAMGITEVEFDTSGWLYSAVDENTVAFNPADGDPWFYFRNAVIKEDAKYVLVQGPAAYGDNGGLDYFVEYTSFLFVKTPDKLCPGKLVFTEVEYAENDNLAVTISASSTLASQGNYNYYATNLLDKNLSTCWAEGNDGLGIGETITIDLGGVREVNGIEFLNGYTKTYYLYTVNEKVTSARITASDGTSAEATFYVEENIGTDKEPFMEYDSKRTSQSITFDMPVKTDKITFTILGASNSGKYSDVSISEMKVY